MTSESVQTREPIFPLDPDTAVLVGAHISQLRTERNISLDGLVTETSRTEQWLVAVERGELELTRSMVVDLGVMFHARGHLIDLLEFTAELQQFPMGVTATQVRGVALAGSRSTRSNASGTEKGVSHSVMDAISGSDRFLVVTPTIVLGAIVVLASRMLDWSLEASDQSRWRTWSQHLTSLLDKVLLPGVVVAAISAALSLHAAERMFQALAKFTRTKDRAVDLGGVGRMLRLNGVTEWADTSGWSIDRHALQLIPRYRDIALNTALRASFTERVEPMLWLGWLVSFLAAGFAALAGGVDIVDIGPFAVFVGIGLLVRRNHREAEIASDECRCAVAQGLGWYDINLSQARASRPKK